MRNRCLASLLLLLFVLSGCGDAVTARTANLALTIFLQDGHLGYTGTTDTSITRVPDALNPNPGTYAFIRAESHADATTGKYGLIRFDLEPVKRYVEEMMTKAGNTYSLTDCATQLVVNTTHLNIVGTPSSPFGNAPSLLLDALLLTAPLFGETNDTTWDNASAGVPWDKIAGATDLHAEMSLGKFDSQKTYLDFGHWYRFHIIREYVQSWLCDSTTNKGMRLSMGGGGTTTGMAFFSSEHTDPARRPILEVSLQVFATAGESSGGLDLR
jgi:hypothetical protein